jgi:hypothetical protein
VTSPGEEARGRDASSHLNGKLKKGGGGGNGGIGSGIDDGEEDGKGGVGKGVKKKEEVKKEVTSPRDLNVASVVVVENRQSQTRKLAMSGGSSGSASESKVKDGRYEIIEVQQGKDHKVRLFDIEHQRLIIFQFNLLWGEFFFMISTCKYQIKYRTSF